MLFLCPLPATRFELPFVLQRRTLVHMSAASSPDSAPRTILVRETPIELCQFLKFGGLASSGGEAKQVIGAGRVTLNGVVETQKRKKLVAGDRVAFDGTTLVVQVRS